MNTHENVIRKPINDNMNVKDVMKNTTVTIIV